MSFLSKRKSTKGEETHIQDLSLFLVGSLQSDVYVPAAFVVQNIGSDFANLFWRPIAVEIIVLNLEVFSDGDQDGERHRISLIRVDTSIAHAERDWEVERIVCSLVNDNLLMPREKRSEGIPSSSDGPTF